MTTSHQHNHRHHRHPPLCLLVPFPPNSLVARNEEGSCGSARCSTTDDTATPHSPHCSSYIFTLQTIHYEFKIMFWILVSAPQLITHVCCLLAQRASSPNPSLRLQAIVQEILQAYIFPWKILHINNIRTWTLRNMYRKLTEEIRAWRVLGSARRRSWG